MPGNGVRHDDLIEYHRIPHGYVLPKEHHHWWWYFGLAVTILIAVSISVVYWQFDQAQAPLCTRQVDTVMTSPGGNMELVFTHVSCMGGAPRQKLVLRQIGGGHRTVISFDDNANIRGKWLSDSEIAVTQKGGKMLTFEPQWGGVRVHYQ